MSLALATAGNLSISQAVISTLQEGLEDHRDRQAGDARHLHQHVPGDAARRGARCGTSTSSTAPR